MPRTPRDPTVEAQPSYACWKDAGAQELKRLHGIEATAIPEREWTKIYIRGHGAGRSRRESRAGVPQPRAAEVD